MEKPKAWFWDVFPNHCTKAWYGFMIAALVVSFLWRDPTYAWWADSPWIFGSTISLLILLVVVGNAIPGIPNMLAPLMIGWACAAGLCVPMTVVYGLVIFNAATFGSLIGYALGDGTSFINDFDLDDSIRYQEIAQRVKDGELDNGLIFKSRVGRFAAYCGHVNIAAGQADYYCPGFILEAAVGHFLWTIQYLAIGFALGHLPEIWKFTIANLYIVWAAIICALIVAMVIYIIRNFRVVKK